MKSKFICLVTIMVATSNLANASRTEWGDDSDFIEFQVECEDELCATNLSPKPCDSACPQWASEHETFYELQLGNYLTDDVDDALSTHPYKIPLVVSANESSVSDSGCFNATTGFGNAQNLSFFPELVGNAEAAASCDLLIPTTNGSLSFQRFQLESVGSAQWIEVVAFISDSEQSTDHTGKPHCSDEAKALMADWFPASVTDHNTYSTLFECVLIKIPVETSPSQSPIVEESEDVNGNAILTTEFQLDTPLLSDDLETFNQDWEIVITEGFLDRKLCDALIFNGDDGNPNGLCEFDAKAPNDVEAIDLSISELDQSWKIRVAGAIEAQAEECPSDKLIYLEGRKESPYTHHQLAMPLIVDQDGDGYAHRPHLCNLVDQNLLQCDESTCDNDCPSEACMVCAIDCDDPHWDPDDLDDNAVPNVGEECNGLDDDGDGQVDEALSRVWLDEDGDGFGDINKATECNAESLGRSSIWNTDCNDAESLIYPGAPPYPILESYIDPEFGQESQRLVDTNCDGFSEPWRYHLKDWDQDGQKESLSFGPAFNISLSELISYFKVVQDYVAEQDFTDPTWKPIENLYLEPGYYPAAMVVDGFSLSIQAIPSEVILGPVDPKCDGDCRSMLSVVGGGNVSIYGLRFQGGLGTSEAIYQALTGELPWNDESAPSLPGWVDIPTPTESSDTVDFDRQADTGLAQARNEGGFRNGRSDEAGLDTPTPSPTSETEIDGEADAGTGDYDWVHYCPGAESVDDFRVGGAIMVHDSQIVIDQVDFAQNQAHGGSAVALISSPYETTFLNNHFVENQILEPGATYKGMINGALLVDNSKATIQGNHFEANGIEDVVDCYPTLGAALGLVKSHAVVKNNQFESNWGRYGSAITSLQSTRTAHSVEVVNNTFWQNHARVAGGAILVLNSEFKSLLPAEFTFKHNILSHNSSDGMVGGMAVIGGVNQLSENLIARNFAPGYGGLLMLSSAGQSLSNFTFDGNHSLLVEPTTPLMEGDLALLTGERALEILEDLQTANQGELMSMTRLFQDIESGLFQVPMLSKSTLLGTESQNASVEIPEENHQVSRTLFTSVYDIEYTRSCEGVDYSEMAYEALRVSDYHYCTPQEDWLKLAEDPYIDDENEDFYLEHDYHLGSLFVYNADDDVKPMPAHEFDEFGAYRGSDPARQLGTFYSQCLPAFSPISMDINQALTATNYGALIDEDLRYLDTSDLRRQDAYIFYLRQGEALNLKTQSETFTVEQRLYGPESFIYHVPSEGPEPQGCEGIESERHFGEIVDYEVPKDGYYLLIVTSETPGQRGPYTIEAFY